VVSQRSVLQTKRQDAPGRLELVREFLNTRNLELGTDALDEPANVQRWFQAHHLIDAATAVSTAEWQQTIEVRESLRALALVNTGHTIDPAHTTTLDDLARDADVRLRYQPDGTQTLAPRPGDGVLLGLGRILAIVGTAALDGRWKRFKVCRAEDCLWAFYDHSRNRSGVWCQMAECGNRAKVRTYRRRHKPAHESRRDHQ
jgi:predicted RNA-binding Zn ribbon-like protein